MRVLKRICLEPKASTFSIPFWPAARVSSSGRVTTPFPNATDNGDVLFPQDASASTARAILKHATAGDPVCARTRPFPSKSAGVRSALPWFAPFGRCEGFHRWVHRAIVFCEKFSESRNVRSMMSVPASQSASRQIHRTLAIDQIITPHSRRMRMTVARATAAPTIKSPAGRSVDS